MKQSVFRVMGLSFRNKFIVVIIGLILASCAVMIGTLPCGWLDNSLLIHSGCRLQLSQEVTSQVIGFTPNGDNLLISSSMGKLRLWRVADGTLMRVALDKYTSSTGEALSPDGKIVAVLSFPGVQLWRFDDGRPFSQLGREEGGIVKVVFSPKGDLVSAAVYDRTPKIPVWRITDGKLLRTFEGHTWYVNDVAISPDETILASASSDRTVRLWRISDGALLHILKGHVDWVSSVAFSPDGTTLASGATDKTICLWRVSDGKLLQVLRGHTDRVLPVAFSPDGTLLASGGGDGTLRLWRVADGMLLRTSDHGLLLGSVRSVVFSPDGTMIATAQGRGPVRLFDVQQMLE